MTDVLELAQLLEHDGEAEVDVGRRRVDPELDPQRTARARACASSSPVGQAVDGVARQPRRLLGAAPAGIARNPTSLDRTLAGLKLGPPSSAASD